MWHKTWMLVVATVGLLWGCTQGFKVETGYLPAYGPWNDGTYTTIQNLPAPQLLVVQVDIAQGQIAAIRLLQHPAWTAPQEQELLLRSVLTRQTTAGYAPRNDGSEQDLLLHAIEEVLYKARRETSSAP